MKTTRALVLLATFIFFGSPGWAGNLGSSKPVSWWRADGNASDQISHNDGVLQGGTTYASGKIGQAFCFQSVGDAITASTHNLPVGKENRTLACWVFIDSFLDGAESFFAGYGNFGTGGQAFSLGAFWDHRLFVSQWGEAIFGPVLNSGQWYHVAVTSMGTNAVILYLNGSMVAIGSFSFDTPANSTFYIGGVDAPYNTRQTIGLIDEVRVYKRALAPTEIRELFQAGSSHLAANLSGQLRQISSITRAASSFGSRN